MYTFIFFVALFAIALMYGFEQLKRRPVAQEKAEPFEPEEIGDLTVTKGDKLECTESYGDFTKGYNYIVRVAYGGALVVWNDEGNYVLAAGLDPRKFKVVAQNVDGTANMQIKKEDE